MWKKSKTLIFNRKCLFFGPNVEKHDVWSKVSKDEEKVDFWSKCRKRWSKMSKKSISGQYNENHWKI